MIVVSDVVVRYGTRAALSGVTATFEPGAITALVGHNGSGKSTLLQALAGTVTPSTGRITGTDRADIAYVPQRSSVRDELPLSVREVVAMGAWRRRGLWRRLSPEDRRAVDAALDRLGVAHLSTRRIGDLSGGQRQRALLAQAVVQRGQIVLLDEPATGLDAEARAVIVDVMRDEARRGAIVVVATHDRRDCRDADQVLRLEDGILSTETTAFGDTVCSDTVHSG
ncbi:metal ABC transporter ATP-binding protein [Rhodococcus triatomae]|uniref:Zinc/manganese transport system ATP-binding protein n=1 Tax=Rhodococcus triatomae TaxID=300028 RepID=A0A1G8CI80_9NOCA|nr:zinc ABC transporter ATP-binding protein AztA [Rhodococcus triatomae]QNG18648.1 metal ABC transporter ATP-binding protein [Rhodococcus triatomae]QNG21682.1 metal ABC transporter ATP-binding protein [Rhodococcus triatomae]SDH45147.1 zinc/manganese transport system ATP-binding protein [Rhodococcus triatomae]